MKKPVKSCRTCKSCRRIEEFDQNKSKMVISDATGACVRYPPHPISATQSAFPLVKLDGWPCDEWRQA